MELDRTDLRLLELLQHDGRASVQALSEAVHRKELIAGSSESLALALVRQGKAAEALVHAQRAVEIFTHLCSPRLANAQAILAECEKA